MSYNKLNSLNEYEQLKRKNRRRLLGAMVMVVLAAVLFGLALREDTNTETVETQVMIEDGAEVASVELAGLDSSQPQEQVIDLAKETAAALNANMASEAQIVEEMPATTAALVMPNEPIEQPKVENANATVAQSQTQHTMPSAHDVVPQQNQEQQKIAKQKAEQQAAEQRKAELAKQQEVERLAEQKKAEQQKLAKQKAEQQAAEQRKAELAKQKEVERLAEQKKAEQQKIAKQKAEQQAAEQRKAELAKQKEAERLAEQKKAELKKAEQKKQAKQKAEQAESNKVQTASKTDPKAILEGRSGKVRIQAGAYHQREAAEKQLQRLADVGVSAMLVEASSSKGTVYRVRTAAFDSQAAANQALKRMKEKGIDGVVVGQ